MYVNNIIFYYAANRAITRTNYKIFLHKLPAGITTKIYSEIKKTIMKLSSLQSKLHFSHFTFILLYFLFVSFSFYLFPMSFRVSKTKKVNKCI